jgi:peptide/nickel transport system substrate-binding protein
MSEPTGDPQIERFLQRMEQKGFSRRELLQRAVAGGTALTLPALIAACGGGDDEEAGGAPTGGGDTATGAGEPNPGGNLRLAVVGGGNSETLDFNQSLNEIDVVFTRAMF